MVKKSKGAEHNRSPRVGWALSGALSAGLLASACCTLPLVLITLGVGGAWLSTLHALEPLRPLFAIAALGLLAFGFHRHRRAVAADVCEPGSECANPSKVTKTRRLLWLGAVLTALLVASPNILGWLLQ